MVNSSYINFKRLAYSLKLGKMGNTAAWEWNATWGGLKCYFWWGNLSFKNFDPLGTAYVASKLTYMPHFHGQLHRLLTSNASSNLDHANIAVLPCSARSRARALLKRLSSTSVYLVNQTETVGWAPLKIQPERNCKYKRTICTLLIE